MIKKRIGSLVIGVVLLGVMIGVVRFLSVEKTPAPRPNILIITMDTTRADHLGCYGYQHILTPNIDAIAAEGILFEEAFSVQPVTLPSHCSIFTGQYPFRHGVRDNNIFKLARENLTLAEILVEQEYLTTAFLASYILDSQFGLDQGFHFYNDRFVKPKQKGKLPVDRRASEVSFLVGEWLEVTQAELQNRPFFLWLHYYDPHADYNPPHPYKTAYPNQYDGEIAYMDDWLGYVFNELKERGLWENTLVVLVADHGESLGEYGERTHGIFIYRPTTHVPLIIRYPDRLPQGVRIQDRVSIVDIVPTILELLEIEVEASFDGESLMPLIKKRKRDKDRAIYSEAFIPKSFNWSELQGFREGKWLFIDAPSPELYEIGTHDRAIDNVWAVQAQTGENMRDRLHTILQESETTEAEDIVVDEEMIQRLRELGYFAGGGTANEEESDERRPDPKEKIHLFNAYQRANSLIVMERYEAAAALFEQILAEDPDNPRFRMEAGDAYMKAKDFPHAEIHLKHALSLHPEDARSHYLLGQCYNQWGKADEALREYEATLAINPKHFLAHFHSGLLHIVVNRWDEAEQAFVQARRLKPKDPSLLNNLGYIAMKGKHDFQKGIGLIHQALESAPRNPNILGSLGSAYLTIGDYEQAAQYLERSLAIVPDDLQFIAELKKVYQAQGEPEKVNQLEERERLLGN